MNLLGAVGLCHGVGNTDIVASWFKGHQLVPGPRGMKITATGTFGKESACAISPTWWDAWEPTACPSALEFDGRH